MALLDADADTALVRIRDLAGHTRGTGFLADHEGTVVTSHEAVDGAAGLVLQPMRPVTATGGAATAWTRPVEPSAITPLPGSGLALIRTTGFRPDRLRPLPIGTARPDAGAPARLWAGGWLDGTVVGPASGVTYTAGDRVHHLDHVLELALCAGGREALRLGGPAIGGPVLDGRTGVVLGVLGSALHAGRRAGGLAVPLRAVAEAAPGRPLAALLARNAATVPAYGSELNPAGVLRLTALSASPSAAGPGPDPVERPEVQGELTRFTEAASGASGARVLALVGGSGTGRSTELARLAARRSAGGLPAPTVRLRGADLRAGDEGLRSAVGRALRSAGRTLVASGRTAGDPTDATPETVAALAAGTGRPLLVLLDGPEEMPAALARHERLAEWTAATAHWLRTARVQLVIACRPTYWERAGALFPPGLLHRPLPGGAAPALPDCVAIGDLPERAAERARERYGLPPGAPAAPDARHPLTLRLLAELREELAGGGGRAGAERGNGETGGEPDGELLGAPDRHQIFDAYLDLMSLRIAVRIAAGYRPAPRGTAVRRLAAQVAGQVHEAARRCLASVEGALDRPSFEEVFPVRAGWSAAVLAEGLLVPAGPGYRFAHDEFGEWLQGAHVDLDLLTVPGHRPAPVVEALLRLARQAGQVQLAFRLAELVPTATADGEGPLGASRGGGLLPAPGEDVPQPPLLTCRGDRGDDDSGDGHFRGGGSCDCDSCDGPSRDGDSWAWDSWAWESCDGRSPDVTDAGAEPPVPGGAPELEPWPGLRPGAWGEGAAVASLRPVDGPRWARQLLAGVLLRLPDAGPYTGVLRLLADRITERSLRAGGFAHTGLDAFGSWFWERLALADEDRLDLLRRLVPADGRVAGGAVGPPARFLDAAAGMLRTDPQRVQPLLCTWFDDTRLLGAGRSHRPAHSPVPPPRTSAPSPPDSAPLPDASAPAPREITVAAAAQALLYAHRRRAPDALAEALVAAAHPRGDELLGALAEDEPSTVCRAVARWAHDPCPRRRAAAASYGLRAAPHARTEVDRALLRRAALDLLSGPEGAPHETQSEAVDEARGEGEGEAKEDVKEEAKDELLAGPLDKPLAGPLDGPCTGSALALLVGDPVSRPRYLARALARFVAGDPQLPPTAFAGALAEHPVPVLAAFRARLVGGGGPPVAAALLRLLAGLDAPATAARAASLVRDYARHSPDRAARPVAEFVAHRLERGPAARAALRPFAGELITGCPAPVRCALADVLAEAGSGASEALRGDLLEALLAQEEHERGPYGLDQGEHGATTDTSVLEALLRAAAEGCERRPAERTRDLVRRTGALLAGTPGGAARFERQLAELTGRLPGFARRLRGGAADQAGAAAARGARSRTTAAGSRGG
ncbi:serine protease [Streptomyces sp. NRRL S-337]|uniref:serine protease n=1 Tax=Streptomyces sp. NRRL S-337 TaxID=1463900 RepID=UPI00055A1241|nr:serine protease [Streptomyces sp. NRRL S-337]